MSVLLDHLINERRTNPRGGEPRPEYRADRLLHPSSKVQTIDELGLLLIAESLAGDLEIEEGDLVGERRFRRLVRTSAFEAWRISWGASTFLGLHDHGGSLGAFQIVSGSLVETSTEVETAAPLTTLHLGAGTRRSFGATHVHEIWNPAETTALSVHVYSPPLTTMNFFSHEPSHYLQLLRTETEVEWPDPEGGSRNLSTL